MIRKCTVPHGARAPLFGRASVVASAAGLFSVFTSCAHYDSTSGTYDGAVFAPIAGQSRPLDYVEGVIGGIAIIYEMGRVSSGSSAPQIFGTCRIKMKRGMASDAGKERCQETFISFRHLKSGHDTKVWVDSVGEFSFNIVPGDSYEVSAVNERLRARSKSIRVSRPGQIQLEIDIETVEANPGPVVTTGVSLGASSDVSSRVSPGTVGVSNSQGSNDASKIPLSDFGLKPTK